MKIAIGILIVIAGILTWQLNAERAMNAQQKSQIVDFTAKLNDKRERESLERQEKCATQAEKVFREAGYSLSKDINQSHFNPELNKCFMSFSSTSFDKSVYSREKWLLDAYELREYAHFIAMKLSSVDLPPDCRLIPLAEKEGTCKSESEYDAFVARYME